MTQKRNRQHFMGTLNVQQVLHPSLRGCCLFGFERFIVHSNVSCRAINSIFMHVVGNLCRSPPSPMQEYEKALAKLERLEKSTASASKSESVSWLTEPV